MKRYFPTKVIIEQDAADLPLTRVMLKKLEGVPRELTVSLKPYLAELSGIRRQEARDTLLVCKNEGKIF